MNKQVTIVAVDGPSASGKSTVSRRTAQAVGFIYVDSGALYRGITWKCVKEGIDVKDSQAVTNLLIRMNMELVLKDGAVGYLIDGEDPGQEIRAEPVRERVAENLRVSAASYDATQKALAPVLAAAGAAAPKASVRSRKVAR